MPSYKELNKLIKKLGLEGNVQLLGEVTDKELLEIYKDSSFIVSASEYEGFGLSALEGMGAGLIPVLNDIPPFKRFVKGKRK